MAALLGIVQSLFGARNPLRAATRVGRAPHVLGEPLVFNDGTIEIGDDFSFSARPASSHLAAVDGGRISIGNRVAIAYGAAFSARLEIAIGDDVRIGPFAVVMDSDFHVVGDRSAIDEPLAVRIESGARLGARVTVLRGSTIGAGAVVLDGSVVSGRVAPGTVVSGVPARVVVAGAAEGEAGVELPQLIMAVLGLPAPPAASDGPAQIREWDSLGALKIVLAVEESYGVSLSEQEIKAMQSVSELARVIDAARARTADKA